MHKIEFNKYEVWKVRFNLLQNSDWTQLPDVQMTAEKRAEWATYRQALRDLSKTIGEKEVYTLEDFPTPPQRLRNPPQPSATPPQ